MVGQFKDVDWLQTIQPTLKSSFRNSSPSALT
jgi:hypothetical protein